MTRRRHRCDIPGCGRDRWRWQRICNDCFGRLSPHIRSPLLQSWTGKPTRQYREWLRRAADYLAGRPARATPPNTPTRRQWWQERD